MKVQILWCHREPGELQRANLRRRGNVFGLSASAHFQTLLGQTGSEMLWFVSVRGETTSSSPLLQYCSSRLVLSYKLPHDATLSDILPASRFPALLCPPLAPLAPRLHAVTPSCLPHIHGHTGAHTYTCPGSPSPLPLPLRSPTSRRRQASHCLTPFPPRGFTIRVA